MARDELSDLIEDLPSWLRRNLVKSNLTYAELAEELGVNENTIGYWTRGISTPMGIHLLHMFEIFGYGIYKP